MNSTTTVIDLIKEVLIYAADNLQAKQFYIDRLETGNLTIDWSDGGTPSISAVICTNAPSEQSPLHKLCTCVNAYSIIVCNDEKFTRLEIADGIIVFSEVVARAVGSRIVLKDTLFSGKDFAQLKEFCDSLATCRLGTSFGINDYTNNDHETLHYEDDSDYLAKNVNGNSPIKVFHGLSSTATGYHTFYSVALTTSLSTQIMKHFHGSAENVNTKQLIRELDSMIPADHRARKLSIVIRTIDVDSHLDPDVVLFSVLNSIKGDVFEYICNLFSFGLNLDYNLDLDEFKRRHCPSNRYMHAGISACMREGFIEHYSPLYLYGSLQHRDILSAALNSFEVEYRRAYPHHTIMKVSHENLERLIDSPYEHDCIIIDNLEKLLREISEEEEYKLSDVLLLRKYLCKMTFVISGKKAPHEIDACMPLQASLNKGLVINAV